MGRQGHSNRQSGGVGICENAETGRLRMPTSLAICVRSVATTSWPAQEERYGMVGFLFDQTSEERQESETSMLWWWLRRLTSNDFKTRWIAAEKLARYKNSRAVDALVRALNSSDSYLRARAAESLGKIGDHGAVEPLIASLERSGDYAQASITALGQLGDARAAAPLVEKMKYAPPGVQRDIEVALGRLGPAATGALLDGLRGKDIFIAISAATALHNLGWVIKEREDRISSGMLREAFDEVAAEGDAAVPPLAHELISESPRKRKAAAVALGKTGSIDAFRPLAEELIKHGTHGEVNTREIVDGLYSILQMHGSSIPKEHLLLIEQLPPTVEQPYFGRIRDGMTPGLIGLGRLKVLAQEALRETS